ncbi:hypothetical protein N6H14_27425 [Paenibacillus sp. CC-CFT747]|nr:hypothetical protein N6H14_27425 [Paenibacillus sp. CC-CFT747]
MNRGKRFVALVLVLLFTALMPVTAGAASYSTYTQVSLLPNDVFTATEGLALANGYAYSAKVEPNDTQMALYSTKMTSGATTLMTNGSDNTNILSYLSHANDMAATVIDGVTYLFVATLKNSPGTIQLLKLKVVGNTYFLVGSSISKILPVSFGPCQELRLRGKPAAP